MTMPLGHFPLLPGWPASAARLLSRVGCRCAGTSRPIRRSREGAASPSRSTEADPVPLTPVSLRFHLNRGGHKRDVIYCLRLQRRMPTDKSPWMETGEEGRVAPPPAPPFPTRPRPCCVQGQRRKSDFKDDALNGTNGVKVEWLFTNLTKNCEFYGQTKVVP